MKKIILIFTIIFFSLGFVNISKAEITKAEMETIRNLFSGIGGDSEEPKQEQKTPKQQARDLLVTFQNGERYANLIDQFIENKKDDSVYLNKIYGKVMIFDLSKYHSSVPNKDATLAAVISYIRYSLEEILGITSN